MGNADSPVKEDKVDVETANIYLALAEGARRDFQTVYAIEWKVNLGLWTFFVAGVASLITYDKGPLPCWVSVIVTVACLILLLIYAAWWLPHLQNTREQWTRAAWWWSMAAVCGKNREACKLPDYLEPVGWDSPGHVKKFRKKRRKFCARLYHWVCGALRILKETWTHRREVRTMLYHWECEILRTLKEIGTHTKRWSPWHISHVMCVCVTALLMLLFLGALWVRTGTPDGLQTNDRREQARTGITAATDAAVDTPPPAATQSPSRSAAPVLDRPAQTPGS